MKAFFIEHKNAGVKNEILSEYSKSSPSPTLTTEAPF